ncbi:class I SAM-dependent DNA methyltransferase [Methylosinus sporium]|uniref:site-specific DNA-methyltransferase (adenine-specific) n=1 Tax=Methylosinus sporium TaxID=428 RepID=A0A549T6W8_METSR|nr:DNA methyltransferase [Methylosinus sporium]TRL37586.1 class I SAM-dependent DNA methyltransferase [Methylosinus sporium]
MTPDQFIEKWHASTLKERSASQSHFNDLCKLLEVENPTDADPKGEWYCFERGASKTAGGEGWADVWRRGCFGWEYKGKRKDLTAAYAQLQQYAVALENPPLLVVSDMDRIVIHTNWTNTVSEVHGITLDELRDANKRDLLRAVFTDPERLKPKKTIDALTREVADKFAGLAIRLREAGHDPHVVAHFVNRLVFCMFAEDINFLPRHLFSQILDRAKTKPEIATTMLRQLFAAMRSGGLFGVDEIEWFNGGLFDDDTALPLTRADIKLIGEAAAFDWSDIDPSIFGTLFERGLDPAKRSQLGAHYTDPEKIMMIVRPVIIEPLWREWGTVRAQIEKPRTSEKKRRELLNGFLERLRGFRVLDPACGSGNFLYLALLALKDIEHRVNLEAEAIGLGRQFPTVGPEVVQGIELNPYAAELARVTIWIGEIQWMRKNGFDVSRKPILKPLQSIDNRDAILAEDGTAAKWPPADVIIGNPPFMGAKLMKRRLGVDTTEAIRALYTGRLPGFTDLVCYWFENARSMIEGGGCVRAGLVATNSIRKNTNLPVLHRISDTTRIFEAWSEEEWTVDGANVDVSLICFGDNGDAPVKLNGANVQSINPDLTTGLDLTKAKLLRQNQNGAFLGIQKSGPFDVPGATARAWMNEPLNPNGRSNAEVLKPYWNGDDVTGRPRDMWFIDFPIGLAEGEASLLVSPFHHVANTPDEEGKLINELREALGERAGPRWWEPHWPRPEMRSRIMAIPRYIVTPETAQYRLFVWLSYPTLPDKNLVVIPRADDLMFGILHSRFHEVWALRKGSDLQDRPRYTHTTTFATYPFPDRMTPNIDPATARQEAAAQRIELAARRLNDLRNGWLYPADLIKRVPEVVPGYPDRILPAGVAAKAELKKRTLTNLYNARPAWLANAHAELDAAVAAAYGWPADLSDDEILKRLLALNLEQHS